MGKSKKEKTAKGNRGNTVKRIKIIRKNEEVIEKLSNSIKYEVSETI